MSSDKLNAFLTATDRYKKAAARRCLTERMPMSPDTYATHLGAPEDAPEGDEGDGK